MIVIWPAPQRGYIHLQMARRSIFISRAMGCSATLPAPPTCAHRSRRHYSSFWSKDGKIGPRMNSVVNLAGMSIPPPMMPKRIKSPRVQKLPISAQDACVDTNVKSTSQMAPAQAKPRLDKASIERYFLLNRRRCSVMVPMTVSACSSLRKVG